MRLSEADYDQFLRLHRSLLYYTGVDQGILSKSLSQEEVWENPQEWILTVREKLYADTACIDRYVKQNPDRLAADELDLVAEFRHFRSGNFTLYKYLKNYTLFLDEEYAYGVLALSDPFQHFFGDNLPLYTNAVLLPFKGKIVYDGMMRTYRVYIGSGLRKSLRLSYNESKAKYGVITSLPIPKRVRDKELDEAEQLRLYMKTANSRDMYHYEIEELAEKSDALYEVYLQEWGRVNSRAMKKSLKSHGIKGKHFAVLGDVVVASGDNKKELDKRIADIIPTNKRGALYFFKT